MMNESLDSLRRYRCAFFYQRVETQPELDLAGCSVLYVPPWDMTTRYKMTNSWYPTLKKCQESEEWTQKCVTDLAVCWGQHSEVNKRWSQQQGGKSDDDFSVLTLLNPSTESLTCSLHTTSATLSKYCTVCYRAQLLQTSVISKSLVPKGPKTTRYSSTSPEQTAGSWWIKKNTLEGADENTLETHLHLKHLADAGFLKTEPQSVAPGPFWRERELLMDTTELQDSSSSSHSAWDPTSHLWGWIIK